MIFKIPPSKYAPKPTCRIPEIVKTMNVTTAAIVPHLDIKSLKLSRAISSAVFGDSRVCF